MLYDTSSLLFLSTLSLRRATTSEVSDRVPLAISIHALLAESDSTSGVLGFYPLISIHALLAESDSPPSITPAPSRNFYPRSPCGERHGSRRRTYQQGEFLSTLSLRRATFSAGRESDTKENFYPRSPCGERQPTASRNDKDNIFLSTLSLRRATAKVYKTVGHFCAYETNFMGIASSC